MTFQRRSGIPGDSAKRAKCQLKNIAKQQLKAQHRWYDLVPTLLVRFLSHQLLSERGFRHWHSGFGRCLVLAKCQFFVPLSEKERSRHLESSEGILRNYSPKNGLYQVVNLPFRQKRHSIFKAQRGVVSRESRTLGIVWVVGGSCEVRDLSFHCQCAANLSWRGCKKISLSSCWYLLHFFLVSNWISQVRSNFSSNVCCGQGERSSIWLSQVFCLPMTRRLCDLA